MNDKTTLKTREDLIRLVESPFQGLLSLLDSYEFTIDESNGECIADIDTQMPVWILEYKLGKTLPDSDYTRSLVLRAKFFEIEYLAMAEFEAIFNNVRCGNVLPLFEYLQIPEKFKEDYQNKFCFRADEEGSGQAMHVTDLIVQIENDMEAA